MRETVAAMAFYPKQFIKTAEGLLFAVVAEGIEEGRVRCFLRYVYQNEQWCKVKTAQANQWIKERFSHYIFYSTSLDATLHGVLLEQIVSRYDPYAYRQHLLTACYPLDPIQKDCLALYALFEQDGINVDEIGVTGSLLIHLQKASSDIDLVCCSEQTFEQCRAAINRFIAHDKLQRLSMTDWLEAYRRRECELSFDEYVWHEKRKDNKAIINGRKFDLALVLNTSEKAPEKIYQKKGLITLRATVLDDVHAFHYPSELQLDHPTIKAVVSFSATYVGQACKNELIETTGFLEQDQHGKLRIVVGSDREAVGHYIKVLQR